MKKILLTATLLVGLSAMSNAQDKGVGINTTTPKASLDVATTSDNTMPDAVLVPRFSLTQLQAKDGAYAADQNGALVFVNDITGTPGGKTVNIAATGFYYYDSVAGQWKTLGGGGSAVDTSLYLNDGQLGGNRIVTHNNNNLTFTTGTGRVIVNGTQQNTGAVYMKTRPHVGDLLASTWASDDYSIILSGTNTNISLPDAAANSGRVISLTNQSGSNRTFVSGSAFKPQNLAALASGKAMLFISDGATWQILGGYL